MNTFLSKANALRKSGALPQAIASYTKAYRKCHERSERNICLYMLAFTYVLIAHRLRGNLYELGADLRLPYYDAYQQAHQYLERLDEDFDPISSGLPSLTYYERDEIALYA